jgi:hypothetical protein
MSDTTELQANRQDRSSMRSNLLWLLLLLTIVFIPVIDYVTNF